ncbi:MAG TPA: hypothetical protein VKE69_12720, partial [Planctomycetota bacterium]|nr:hypothetical protein [Planctomycetota bacterium]
MRPRARLAVLSISVLASSASAQAPTSFGAATPVASPTLGQALRLADLDHDGHLDVVLVRDGSEPGPPPGFSESKLFSLRGNGDATFQLAIGRDIGNGDPND